MLELSSDSDDEPLMPLSSDVTTMNRYKAEPQTDISTCPLEWWKTHTGAYGRLAVLTAK